MSENRSPIPSRLYNAAKGGHVAGTADIIDDDKGKTQDVINKETDNALENRYTKEETYSKTELNNLITTPSQDYVSVTATDQTTDVTDVLPATGEADTIYRVGNWDGTQYDDTVYSEYSWNGSAYVKLSTKEVGIDDEPIAGSNNLVKSEGVYNANNLHEQCLKNKYAETFSDNICSINGLIRPNGEVFETASFGPTYKISDKIPVDYGSKIVCSNIFKSSDWAGFALYDKNDNPLFVSVNNDTIVVNTANNYPNVSYFRVAISSNGYALSISIYHNLSRLNDEVNHISQQTENTIEVNNIKKFGNEICNNFGILKPDGRIQIDSGAFENKYKYSDKLYIDNSIKKIIGHNLFNGSGWSGLNIYDENDSLLYAGGGDVDIDISAYPTIKYIRVCTSIYDDMSLSFVYKDFSLNQYFKLENKTKYDVSSLVNEGLIRRDGTLFYDTGHTYGGVYYFSDEISIKSSDKKIFYSAFRKDDSWCGVALYNAEHSVIETFGGESFIDLIKYPDAKYIRFGNFKDNITYLSLEMEYKPLANSVYNLRNKWYGKKWVALGDSWTEGAYVDNCSSYVKVVSHELGLDVINLGVGGTSISDFANNLTQEIANSADLITIWGSINNMGIGGQKCGSIDDTPSSSGTLMANWKYTIERVLALNPKTQLVIIGCPVAFHSSWNGYGPYNSYGDTIESSTKKIGELARHYGIPFIDMYHLSGFNNYNFNNHIFDWDGVHPNKYGVLRVSEILIKQLMVI